VSGGDDAAGTVNNRNGDGGGVLAVGAQARAAGREVDGVGGAGGFDDGGGGELALVVTAGFEPAGLVNDVVPAEVAEALHFFASEALAIEEEFDFLAVAEAPDGDVLAGFVGPVAVGEDVDEWLVLLPPGFPIIGLVLGKAAHVEKTEVGVDLGPVEGSRLTAVIEAGPIEAAGGELAEA